jgi:glucose/arabinose dehydrogenase
MKSVACASAVVFVFAGASAIAQSDMWSGYGPSPKLPPPDKALVPTIDIAPAKGWPKDAKPQVASGLAITALAMQLYHPRWLYVLPNGDILVAETSAPPRPEDAKGVKGLAMKKVMEEAGSAVPSANRITLLRDANGDGKVETRTAFIEGLNSPFGMTLVGTDLYVANTDGVLRFDYKPGTTRIEGKGERKFELPGGPLNHHWTKNIIASRDGKKLYATSGSNSNVAENGMAAEERRAAILELDLTT